MTKSPLPVNSFIKCVSGISIPNNAVTKIVLPYRTTATGIIPHYGAFSTIRKGISTQQTLAGAGISVRIDEPEDLRIIVSALQVV